MSNFPAIQNLGVLFAVLPIVCFCLYRWALPKPIPGIPYNAHAAKRILGDAPDALAWQAKHGDMFSYIPALAKQLDSPIFQMFVRPFGRPWVMVLDPYEAHDIQTRRSKDFDRSKIFKDLFATLLPKFHVHMPTGEEWKAHRKLMNDTMSAFFVHQVAAPQMWHSTRAMIEMWKVKTRLADGRPWDATRDIYKGALEIIWAATFGTELDSAQSQIAILSDYDKLELPPVADSPLQFPMPKDPNGFSSILQLSESLKIVKNSLFPKWAHWAALKFVPSLRAFSNTPTVEDSQEDFRVKSALDLIVAREVQVAAKDNRPADVTSQATQDELFGLLIAGHETTSTTICWTIKLLTSHQEFQLKLRDALRTAYIRAVGDTDSPSVAEITSASIPYLDAVVEEAGRCGLTSIANSRTTKQDTEHLGYHVPKGTEVWLMVDGPGYVMPPVGKVDDCIRSKSSLEQKEKWGAWDDENVHLFVPARWLKQDFKGNTYFDPDAGPSGPFGSGPRGCFGRQRKAIRPRTGMSGSLIYVAGKRWALLEMRIVLTLIFWNFELQPIPAELSANTAIDGMTYRPAFTYVRLKPDFI